MALFATLNELYAAIRSETEALNNAKFDLALPRIVAAAEQRMFYGADEPLRSDPLRLRVMEETQTLALVAGTVDLPDGYLSALLLTWEGSPVTYPIYEAPHSFATNRYVSTVGSPVRYTVDGDQLLVSPKVTGDIVFKFYKRPDALETETATNAVLTTYPMVYFQACLIEAYSYRRNPNEMQKAFGAYVSLAGGLNRSDAKARYGSSSPMAPRIPGWRV